MSPAPEGPRPPSTDAREAASGGALVLGAIVAWNLGNFAFFLIAGRLFGPDDYGLLAALLAIVVAASVPANALAMEIARRVSGSGGAGAEGLYSSAWRLAVLLGAGVVAVGAVVLLPLGGLLAAPAGELLITLATIAMLGPLFLSLGMLQGEDRFGGYAASFSLMGVPRPLLLLPLALLPIGIYAGLAATAISMALALLVGAALTRRELMVAGAQPRVLSDFGRALLPIAVGLLGVGVLTNADIVAARFALTAEEAGVFAATAVLAKAVILPPQAASIVLLPRIAARASAKVPAGELLAFGVLIAIISGALGVLIATVAGQEIMTLTFGESFASGGDILAEFAAASTALGALLILLNHHVAKRETPFLWTMGGVAIVYVLALAIWHESASQIILVGAIVGTLAVVAHEIIYFRREDSVLVGLVLLARIGVRSLRER